jgi:hypothetical protein
MGAPVQLLAHRFPSGFEMSIAELRLPLQEIADRFKFAIQRWDVDGLGPAAGVLAQLPSGRVALLYELQHVTKHYGRQVVIVSADGGDIASLGVAALITEMLEAFHLPPEAVEWRAGEETERSAGEVLAAWNARQSDRK